MAVATLAPDSMTADVLATVVGNGAGASCPLGCAWLMVRADGTVERSDRWPHVGATQIIEG